MAGPPVEGWEHPHGLGPAPPSPPACRGARDEGPGAHFKGIEKNLCPDLQRTSSACTRSTISESSNSSTIFFHREPRKDSQLKGTRDPEATANKTSLLKSFRA